ncbi:Protein of unknown function [Bacillus mycoides]|nr:Protein of unknown function [Bacillus mycoides]
MELAVVQVAET